MTKLILLNGPPRSGKDTAGAMIAEAVVGARCDKFARIMKERTHASYDLLDEAGCPREHLYFDNCKDQPRQEFLGATPRQAYIAFSEQLDKPLHGADVFGRLLLADLEYRLPRMLVVTDSGFREEAVVLVRRLGAENCRLIRLHRSGCDFSRDSRGYIELSDLGVESHDIWNPGTPEGLLEKLRAVVPEMASPVCDQP